jgi:hypothetical protein
MDAQRLEAILAQSWCRETSYTPERWTPANPAYGQCAVTALIVRDYLGGDIVRGTAKPPAGRSVSHYYNRIRGRDVDLTARQFPAGTAISASKVVEPGALLAHLPVRERYELLRARVARRLRRS